MPVQITPFQGSRLTDVVSRGAQINNRREGLRLQDLALGQRQQNLDQTQQRFDQQSNRLDENQKLEAAKAIPFAMLEASEYAATLPEGQRLRAFQQQIGPFLAEAERQGIAPPELVEAYRNAEESHFEPRRVKEKLKQIFETQDGGLVGVTETGRSMGIDTGGAKIGDAKQAPTQDEIRLRDAKLREAEAKADQAEQKAVDVGRQAAVVQETKKSLATIAADILKDPDTVDAVYGSIDGFLPTLGPDAVDAELKIRKLVNLLTLQNVDAVPGVLSDSDIKLLKEAGTTLSNFRLSDSEAKVELARIAGVLGLESDSGGQPLNPTVDARPSQSRFKVSVVQ